jgi:hypothetical protein
MIKAKNPNSTRLAHDEIDDIQIELIGNPQEHDNQQDGLGHLRRPAAPQQQHAR